MVSMMMCLLRPLAQTGLLTLLHIHLLLNPQKKKSKEVYDCWTPEGVVEINRLIHQA